MTIVGEIRFEGWVPIASRPRSSRNVDCKLFWLDFMDAPLSSEQARELAKKGRLLIACRHYHDRVEMMVRSSPAMPVDPDKPTADSREAFRLAGRARQGAW
jgi:hypothetical protein